MPAAADLTYASRRDVNLCSIRGAKLFPDCQAYAAVVSQRTLFGETTSHLSIVSSGVILGGAEQPGADRSCRAVSLRRHTCSAATPVGGGPL